jgi:hypothetical protein
MVSEMRKRQRDERSMACPVSDRDIPGCDSSLWGRLRFVIDELCALWRAHRGEKK